MIWFKKQTIFFIAKFFFVQINLINSQCNGAFVDYGSYYVPYHQSNGKIHYAPSSVNTNSAVIIPVYPKQSPELEQYGPIQPPVYLDGPPASYQGVEQANALRAAYPNQPIIIINNGGNDDSDGRKGSDFNFGDLAAIFLAAKHNHGGYGGEGLPPLPPPPPVVAPQVIPQENYGNSKESSTKSPTVNITIVIQSSSSASEDKKKKKKTKKIIEVEAEDESEVED